MVLGPLGAGGSGVSIETAPARGPSAMARFDAIANTYGVERSGPESAFLIPKELTLTSPFEYTQPVGFGVQSTADLSGGSANLIAIATVPTDERWIVKGWRRSLSTAATRVSIKIGGGVTQLDLESPTSTGNNVVIWGFQLEAGDEIGMIQNGNAADTAVAMTILYTKYKVR